jgi:hypothetical protein
MIGWHTRPWVPPGGVRELEGPSDELGRAIGKVEWAGRVVLAQAEFSLFFLFFSIFLSYFKSKSYQIQILNFHLDSNFVVDLYSHSMVNLFIFYIYFVITNASLSPILEFLI